MIKKLASIDHRSAKKLGQRKTFFETARRVNVFRIIALSLVVDVDQVFLL